MLQYTCIKADALIQPCPIPYFGCSPIFQKSNITLGTLSHGIFLRMIEQQQLCHMRSTNKCATGTSAIVHWCISDVGATAARAKSQMRLYMAKMRNKHMAETPLAYDRCFPIVTKCYAKSRAGEELNNKTKQETIGRRILQKTRSPSTHPI